MLSRLERAMLAAVTVVGLLVLIAGVVLALRWEHVKAWLDAPHVLRVNEAAVELPLPEGYEDDPTRSACAHYGALRCAWTSEAPRDAVETLADRLRAGGVAVEEVRCDDLVPAGPRDGEIACGARVPVRDVEMWVYATDRTPQGGVPLGRTAVWFAWDGLEMPWPLFERVAAADPYPFVETEAVPPSADEIRAALPARYARVLDTCWDGNEPDCFAWEGELDISDLPADDLAGALARELAAAGFFVDGADPTWDTIPLSAHRFLRPGGWNGVNVTVKQENGTVTATLLAL